MIKAHKTLGLATYWQRKTAETLECTPAPLTARQAGQLKHLLRRLGPFAKDAIDYAFANWSKVATRVNLEKGTTTSPTMPHTGFLLAHSDVVLNLMIHDNFIDLAGMEDVMTTLHGWYCP